MVKRGNSTSPILLECSRGVGLVDTRGCFGHGNYELALGRHIGSARFPDLREHKPKIQDSLSYLSTTK